MVDSHPGCPAVSVAHRITEIFGSSYYDDFGFHIQLLSKWLETVQEYAFLHTGIQQNLYLAILQHIPIEATDDDATEEHRYLQYSVEGDDARSFKIDPLTGQLEVARPRIIDCEKKQQYKFKVGKLVDVEGCA
jgi:hypothetical protein